MIDLEKAVKSPGWHSRPDAAREKGIKSLGKTDMRARHNVYSPAPSSAPSNTKMRPYAKGGLAHGGRHGERIPTDNHRPQLGHGEKVRKPIMDTLAKKKGGKCYAQGGTAVQGRRGPRMGWGGDLLKSGLGYLKSSGAGEKLKGLAGNAISSLGDKAGNAAQNFVGKHFGESAGQMAGNFARQGIGKVGSYGLSKLPFKHGGRIRRKAEGGEMEGRNIQRGEFAGREPRAPAAHAMRQPRPRIGMVAARAGSHAPQMGRRRGMERPESLRQQQGQEMHTMKRGGHHKHHDKFAQGGYAHGGEHMPHLGWGGPLGDIAGNIPILGMFTKMIGMKKGGHAQGHHHKRGHHMKKASGGSIYERQMNGEKRNGGHDNYESAMRGEHAVSKPKMAIGGVGKIRHNQATASGAPRSKRHR